MRNLMLALLVLVASSAVQASPFVVARETHVTIAPEADESVRSAAQDFAGVLGRMVGRTIEVTEGDGSSGIALGTPEQFPALSLAGELTISDLPSRERYLLRSHDRGVYIVGATAAAARHGVWDLLHRCGYRQFFPGATWEVTPSTPDLVIDVDDIQQPSYVTRSIWYGYGLWDYNKEPYRQWCVRNRIVSDFKLNTGHAYDHIVHRSKAIIEAHPEYLGLVNGERTSTKLCIGNPAVRAFVVDWAIAYFEKNPDADSISMDPSDGGGWCECKRCAAFDSISDRALTLANTVAEAINERFEDKYVGMYGYGFHSPPPSIRVHPKVVVSLATSFIKGGYSFDELIQGWSAKGAAIGIREYYGVHVWDRDMPLRPRGSNLGYLTRTIPQFEKNEARFLTSESSDNWGCSGLGYYLASRLLWDVKEAEQVDAIVDDFLTRAFGPAKEPMRRFYKLTDHSRPSYVLDDLIGRMYRALDEAARLADSSEVEARINDLVLYIRYVELFGEYSKAGGDARQAAYEQVIRHAYRMRKTMMVHTRALYRDLDNRDRSISLPKEAEWNVAEAKNPWKNSDPFTSQEFEAFVRDGIANHELVELDFEMARYSDDLLPASKLGLTTKQTFPHNAGRGRQIFWTWVETAPHTIELKITGGMIKHYRDRGNVKVKLYQVGGASETGELETLVDRDESVPPDGEPYVVRLKAAQSGVYRIEVSDGHDLTRVEWAEGTPICSRSTLDEPMKPHARWARYFYVPKGTSVIGLHGGRNGRVRNPTGDVALDLEGAEVNFYSVPVPAGMDGKLWHIAHGSAPIRLLNVPPYFARSAEELLLPREVIEGDAR